MEYHNPETNRNEQNLRVLNAASAAPARAYESNPAVRDAFDRELRQLAEEIIEHHPSLTQLLLSLSGECGQQTVANPIHGQN
jgi:hypothetical protein